MPFARNEATRFISPTKTLEYMAAEKPIVSTPITDVAEPYGDVCISATRRDSSPPVSVLDAPEEREHREDAGAVSRNFLGSPPPRPCRIAGEATAKRRRPADLRSQRMPGRTSTDRRRADAAGGRHRRRAHGSERRLPPRRRRLAAGAERPVGGWCRSVEEKGFTFDFAGHIMFSNDPYVHELYKMLLGDNVHWQDREAWIYSKNVYTRYPVPGGLYGLPPDVIKECIVGAIEARYGR